MNKLWTIYDDIIERSERQIRQLEILIIIEQWKDIQERHRQHNIKNLEYSIRQLKRVVNKNVKLREKSL